MPKYQIANITAALILILSVVISRLKLKYPNFYENREKVYKSIRLGVIFLGFLIVGIAFIRYNVHVPLTTYLRGGDFASYYAGALSIREGHNLYRDLASYNMDVLEDRDAEKYFIPDDYDQGGSERLREILESNKIEAIGPFTYPPLNYILFIPWTLFNWHLSFRIWVFINLILIIISILLILKSYKIEIAMYDYFLIGILTAMFHPLTFAQWENQINILVLFLVVLSFYSFKNKNYYLVGFSLALAIHIKVFPVIMTAYFIWKREWKSVIWTLIFILLLSLVIIAAGDFTLISDYISTVFPKWMGYLRPFDMNQSFNGFFSRIFYSGEGFTALYANEFLASTLVKIFSGIIILTTILFCNNNIKANARFFDLEYGLVIVASQLCSSWVLIHHLTWYILPFLILYIHYRFIQNQTLFFPLLISISWILVGFRYEYGIPKYKSGLWIFMISLKFYGMIILWLAYLLALRKENRAINPDI